MTRRVVARATQYPFICVVEEGSSETEHSPAVSDDGEIVLRPGENVLWTGESTVRIILREASGRIRKPEPDFRDCIVSITDQRAMFVLRKYDTGFNYARSNGGVIRIAATAVSAVKAANRRRGHVMTGQISLADAEDVSERRKKSLIGFVDRYLEVLVRYTDATVGLEFWSTRGPDDLFVRVQQAQQRLLS